MKLVKLIILVLLVCLGCQTGEENKPSIEVIKKHLESDIRVFDSYAVVKLPVSSGVQIWNPVQIIQGPDDVMYVANHTGEIYSLRDTDGDGLEDHAELFCDVSEDGLRSPSSIIFKGRDMYVGTAQEVRVYTDTDGDGRADSSRTFFDEIPYSEYPYEWTSALTFGPDNYLYLVLTTDSWNAGASPDPRGWRGAILRISPDGKVVERFATGVRSVSGMLFNKYGDLLFIDNQGGGNPTEELNIAVKDHFYGHNPDKYDHLMITAPAFDLKTEVAPAGMAFNFTGNKFGDTEGDLFVAYYGPGERWERGAIGRLRMQRLPDGNYNIQEFPVAIGIPKISDLEFGSNGDLYVTHVGKTDYWYQPLKEVDGSVYRLIHVPGVEPDPLDSPTGDRLHASESTLERGRLLFAQYACSACHSVDGKTQLLGPNLKDAGRIYTREELLEEITEPSKRIKPSMMASRITQNDGKVLLGRIVGSDDQRVRIMVIGNRIIDVPRNRIRNVETQYESLMYEGLLDGMSEEDVDALISYLSSLYLANEMD